MASQQVKIWDLPTRVFHWVLVAGIIFMWYSAEVSDALMDWHAQIGEFLLALILFRIIWGFVGSENARFGHFLKGPGNTIAYAKTFATRQASLHAGHNPLGGWMVLALILAVLGQAVTGLFATDDILTEGPLYGWVSSDTADTLTGIHHLLFNALLLLVVLHIAAILFYAIVKRTKLVPAMIKGSAEWPQETAEATPAVKFANPLLALTLFLLCYAGVYFGLSWLS